MMMVVTGPFLSAYTDMTRLSSVGAARMQGALGYILAPFLREVAGLGVLVGRGADADQFAQVVHVVVPVGCLIKSLQR
jgi:hypothetical protein